MTVYLEAVDRLDGFSKRSVKTTYCVTSWGYPLCRACLMPYKF